MKILGQGDLRSKADQCLQFALAQSCIDCMTIGSESRAEMGRSATQDPGRERARLSGARLPSRFHDVNRPVAGAQGQYRAAIANRAIHAILRNLPVHENVEIA